MNALTKLYRLKEPPEAPNRYLGANIGEYEFADGGKAWYQSSDDYIKAAVKNVDKQLEDDGQPPLSKKNACVLPKDYKPELDLTTECSDKQANYFQNLIGILRWAVELGRIDIHVQVAALSKYLVNRRIGHLEMALRIPIKF